MSFPEPTTWNGGPDREEDLRHSDPPEILDRVADTVLRYKPKPKTKAAKRRARRKRRKAN